MDSLKYSCQEMDELLYDYIERDLDDMILIALDAHVLTCPSCEATVKSYQEATKTAKQLINMDNIKLPDDLKSQLLKTLMKKQ
jgi:hypothetical protein